MISDEQLSTMSLADLRALQDKLGKRILALASEEKQEAITGDKPRCGATSA